MNSTCTHVQGSTMHPTIADNQKSLAVEARQFAFAYPSQTANNAASQDQSTPSATLGPLNWSVQQGAFQLLIGATGSGKTTLLRNCKASIAPHGSRSGNLAIFGTPLEDLTTQEAASLVGYVAQSPENQIVCDTVWHEIAFGLENLGTPQDTMRRRVAEVAHFFGIEPWFRRQISELSGGQKQIVTLASVLALQPRLLLLDEPTSQLDPVAEKTFLHALFRVNRELGITVVVSTHAPEVMADYATEAVCLEQGKLHAVDLSSLAAKPLAATASKARQTKAAAIRSESSCVTLTDVYYRYGKDSDWVLRGLDLSIASASIHALVGGNGCGKSTLLNVIAGVGATERGRVDNRLAHCQALLPQNPKALFVCDTVSEELAEWQSSCGYQDDDIAEMLDSFHLSPCVDRHPYDLSGGQQQLLALAKLLLTNPKLLLLDEPTKGLDWQAKMQVARAITAKTHEGATIIMATHDVTFAALIADTVTMLFDGENAATQSAEAFFADNLFYRPIDDAFARQYQQSQGGAR